MHCGGSQPRIIEQEGPGAPIMNLGVSWDFCSQPRAIEQDLVP